MYHSSNYVRDSDREYDNNRGSSWTRGFGIGMGYSGGAGEAKKGETSERIGDYDRSYGNSGFGSNYGAGSGYSYGYPLEHNRYNNQTSNTFSTYPTHYDVNRTNAYDSNRYDTRQSANYDVNRYSGYSQQPSVQYSSSQYPTSQYSSSQYPSSQYYGQPTGYRTVSETREVVRDSDRDYRPSFGHGHFSTGRHSDNYNRDHNTERYGNTDRHWSTSGRY